MTFSTFVKNGVIDAILNAGTFSPTTGDVWLSLHSADPAGSGSNEISGGGYSRQQVAFPDATTGTVDNEVQIDFLNMPDSTVTYVGTWTSESGGQFLVDGALDQTLSVSSGDTVSFNAGQIQAVFV